MIRHHRIGTITAAMSPSIIATVNGPQHLLNGICIENCVKPKTAKHQVEKLNKRIKALKRPANPGMRKRTAQAAMSKTNQEPPRFAVTIQKLWIALY
jgi:hypothetical protein